MLVRLLCPLLHHPYLPPEVLLAPSGRWLGRDTSPSPVPGPVRGGRRAGWGAPPALPGVSACGTQPAVRLAWCVLGRQDGSNPGGGPAVCACRLSGERKAPPGAPRGPQCPLAGDRGAVSTLPLTRCRLKAAQLFVPWAGHWHVWTVSLWRRAHRGRAGRAGRAAAGAGGAPGSAGRGSVLGAWCLSCGRWGSCPAAWGGLAPRAWSVVLGHSPAGSGPADAKAARPPAGGRSLVVISRSGMRPCEREGPRSASTQRVHSGRL